MSTHPNVLLITTDQQRFDHLGLKGVKGIDTPNLDRLGNEGVHFDRAYTCCPICTPARVTLLTGQYPSVHGAYSIGVTVDPFPRPTIADMLSSEGYATALFGKTHFVRRADEPSHTAGFKDPPADFFEDFTGPFIGFDEVRTCRGHTTGATPDQHYKVWLDEKGVDYSAWFPDLTVGHDHDACGPWNIPAEYHDTAWVTENTVRWISDRGGQNEPETEPWFCWASFQDPHEPFQCPEFWYDQVRDDEIQLYEGYREGEFADKPPFYRQAYEKGFSYQEPEDPRQIKKAEPSDLEGFEDGHGIPSAFRREALNKQAFKALKATLGMIAQIDHAVGKIMQAIADTGQLEHTIVIFTTDHGEIHGEHGLWHKGLFAYESCQRIPLLIWGPSYIRSRGTVPALANLVDLPCTMLEAAGIEKPIGMQGKSLWPVLKGESDSVQDYTIVELQATEKVYQQTYITGRYKLVVYRDFNFGELYDLHDDPGQYTNLWNSDAHAELKTGLLLGLAQAHMDREPKVAKRLSFA